MFHELPVIKNQLKKCVRCGQCRSVCPVFREIGTENAAPRGHVFMTSLLRDGQLAPSAELLGKLNQCLLCEACTHDCPSGIPVHAIVAAGRDYLQAHQGRVKKILLRSLWTTPRRLQRVHGLARFCQVSGLQKFAGKSGLTKALLGNLAAGEALLSAVPAKTALQELNLPLQPPEPRQGKVGYFLGCATNLFYPNTARALVGVLNKHGWEVIIPKGMGCCGLPQYANGWGEQARTMAAANIHAFPQQVDYIVTDCASCSSTLKSDLYERWADPALEQESRAFQNKIYDINAFLLEKNQLIPPTGELMGLKVTYHDPCHLAVSQKITAPPREILKRIPGVELQEMADRQQCCGGAGTFSFFNYDLSMQILDRKMKLVQDTGAMVVATACPACTLQLNHGLKRAGIWGKVVHPVELLWESYRKQP